MKTNTFLKRITILLMILVMSTAFGAFGQNANSGEIKGTVTDSSNAVIPGAKVTILNLQTGVKTVTVTNGVGIFDAPSVQPGEYTITFSAAGFRDEVRLSLIHIYSGREHRRGYCCCWRE